MNRTSMGLGISLGVCLGATLGTAVRDVGVGVALGVGLGTAFALAFGASGPPVPRTKSASETPLPNPLGLFERDQSN